MSDLWLGLCSEDARPDLRRALAAIDGQARLVFAETPFELRQRVLTSVEPCGAIVGLGKSGSADINTAAALVADGMAREVVLACYAVSDDLRQRARRAGITQVVDITAPVAHDLGDLDDPLLMEDDLPTMVGARASQISRLLPTPEAVPDEVQTKQIPYISGEVGAPVVRMVDMPRRQPSTQDVQDFAGIGGYVSPTAWHEKRRPQSPSEVVGAFQTSTSYDAEAPSLSAPLDEPSGSEHVGVVVQATTKAPVIVFVSGRGGVGKTSLIAAMSFAAASWGMRVGLCDLDLSCGNLYSCFGMPGPVDLSSLAPQGESAGDIGAVGEDAAKGVRLWGPCLLPEMSEEVAPRVGELIEAVRSCSDLVLVDTPATVNDAVAQAAQAADRLVIVVDNGAGSGVAQARWGALAVRLGVARTRICRLANRVGPRGRGEPSINRAQVGLETARELRVLDGGIEVADCMAQGDISDLFALGSRFVESASTALATLLSELGALPSSEDAQKALGTRAEKTRWSFGRRREAS